MNACDIHHVYLSTSQTNGKAALILYDWTIDMQTTCPLFVFRDGPLVRTIRIMMHHHASILPWTS